MITVIIAALDAVRTLDAQLTALAEQSFGDQYSLGDQYEVLVCDNGSMDGTQRLVEQWAERDARVRLIDASQRRGAGYARNVGVAHASGDLIAFCDADDVVAPGWLSALDAACRNDEVIAGRTETVTLNPEWTRIARPTPAGIQTGSFLPFAAACNLAMRRSAFQRVGGFDPELRSLEDVDLCWRLQLAGYSLSFAPDALVHYRLRRSLSGIYRQGFQYGLALAELEHRYRHLFEEHQLGDHQPSAGSAEKSGRMHTIRAALSAMARHPGRGGWSFVLWQLGWHVGHRSARPDAEVHRDHNTEPTRFASVPAAPPAADRRL